MESMVLGIKHYKTLLLLLFLGSGIVGCDQVWNNPHESGTLYEKVGYSSFSQPPKTLDPAKSYSADEIRFTAQIYEPLLQYNYLKRPYTLEPLTAAALPKIDYLNEAGDVISDNSSDDQIIYSRYDITIKPNIYYHPHPAFAREQSGQFSYHEMNEDDLESFDELEDFSVTSTRELVSDDYIYEIKRLADPRVSSPIYGVMSQYVLGMKEFHDQLLAMMDKKIAIDLRSVEIKGLKKIDPHRFQITIKGKYPQFSYWLAMIFFAPVPWEVDQFYSQRGLSEHNLTLAWLPVGTGQYYLAENNPNHRMVLKENPFYQRDYFPDVSDDPEDFKKGYLVNAGKKLPLIPKFIFSLEKETIPRWNKFLQGYYDSSAISSDSFDQAIRIDEKGMPDLTPELKDRGIRLETFVSPSIFYLGFNMLDPVVGGNSEKNKKLRQAISAVIDFNEYIAIFLNGRGLAAQGPIPPGIFGYGDDNNPVTHVSLEQAKQLLSEAGYPNGRDEQTGQPLLLNYDVPSSSGPDDKSRFDWMRKQFAKLGIELNIRSTEYNRFQENMRIGAEQIFMWGWNADYPDPENFLFLLYGPNGKVKYGGENAANYSNAEFDRLFVKMKNMPNSEERSVVIQQMIELLRQDAPWVFGLFPKDYVLEQVWMSPVKPNVIANNTLKFVDLNASQRAMLIAQWNKPRIWPIIAMFGLMMILLIPVVVSYVRREHTAIKKVK